ncbi:MAG TPA: hypothetical protein VLT33_19520 [Labilithrix sp.]|nr:hypothetical protein [Labilithrix sp.]
MAAELVRKLAALVVLIGFVAPGTGCAGARTTVAADKAEYPISLSRAVRDPDGEIVSNERAVKVAPFRATSTAWGIFYSLLRINPRTDISEAVNAQVAAAGGQAVVNLRVMAGHCAMNTVAVLVSLPFLPGCTKVVVEGDIIRLVPVSAPAPAALAAGPSLAMAASR